MAALIAWMLVVRVDIFVKDGAISAVTRVFDALWRRRLRRSSILDKIINTNTNAIQAIKAAFSAPLSGWQGSFVGEIIAIPPGSSTPCAARDCLARTPGKRRYSGRLGNRTGNSAAWQSGGAVVLRRRSKRLKWGVLAGALCAAAIISAPGAARAQGFFDFLFGGPQQRPPPPPSYPPPPPQIGRIAPAPLGQERVNENAGTTGHGVAFCVRLCDGQHFPLERMANATPAETCKAICPTSVTKVYFGSEIEGAVAGDGARYSDLNTAFLYRKHLVANCSCNGKDPFGL